MTEAISMQLGGFLSIYLLLLVIAGIFTYCKIPQTKFLLLGTLQMTVQLIIAGYVLLYIFQNPSPIFVLTYLSLMVGFAVTRTLRKNPWLNRKFKWITALSVIGTCISITSFMLLVVIRKDILTPQYVIPISGMLVSATMNGATLALKSFKENLDSHKQQIEVLLNIGTPPAKILHPFVIQSLETAFLPTMNSMVGMGIIALPGMMTGQILSGTLPMTAIMYQIAIMIVICTTVCLSSFSSLHFGYQTLINNRNQIKLIGE